MILFFLSLLADSGGSRIEVRGSGFDVIQSPVMRATFDGGDSAQEVIFLSSEPYNTPCIEFCSSVHLRDYTFLFLHEIYTSILNAEIMGEF